ncbi:glycosyltransferase family 2 protein [Streptomyces lutosisoli]|uniref:Glycosyltransferase family 2 protein n=2 Tax=Streptomyces lutosisoli TaxID=2665721 RepID=A0ABW2VDX4_9ACTN
MHSVLIAVPTLGVRPLTSLLGELSRQAAEVGPQYAAEIVLLDNSADGIVRLDDSADGFVDGSEAAAAHGAHYRRVPCRGYSQVRNAALDMAAEYDVLIFIDDDEVPLGGWLQAHLQGAERYGADVVGGPVRAVVPPGSPRWLAGGSTLRCEDFPPDGPMGQAVPGTGNTLLRMATVQKMELRFEENFDLFGGEDMVFFAEMAAAGARIVTIGAARVIEFQDPDRLTLKGLMRREYRFGVATVSVDRALQKKWGYLIVRRSAKMARGIARIIGGVTVFRPSTAALGVKDVAFAWGWCTTLFACFSDPGMRSRLRA